MSSTKITKILFQLSLFPHFYSSDRSNLKIKNYKFERVEHFKYLGVIMKEDNNHQIHLQERIKNANKTYFMLQNFFKNKNISKNLH
jgi:hypothetical protein